MKIFDDVQRSDLAYKHERETHFEFLNRCARPEFGHVREFLEQEVLTFPAEGRDDLRRRIRRGSEVDYSAAIFELLLHGGLSRRGYVLRPHPTLPSGRQPDFLVTAPNGDEFYLEATQATEMFDGRDDSADKRKNTALDDLNKDVHADFWLMTSSAGHPTTQPPSKKLRHEVRTWLASLDYDHVTASVAAGGHDAYPTLTWRHETWTLTMRAVPISHTNRGTSEGLVASRSGGSGWVDRTGPLRNALKKKSGHYGELDLPLIVAVNVTSGFLSRMDEVHALYGDHVRLAGHAATTATVSGPLGGFWHEGGRPRRGQLSGAWVFQGLNIYNRHVAKDTLYVHPWGKRPMPPSLMELTTASLAGDTIQWTEPRWLGSVFPPGPINL
jgi:hypothetical protein